MSWINARYLLRGMRRDAGTVVLAVLTLAMGIGFTTTLYSVVRGATRSLPFEDAESLVAIAVVAPGISDPLPATPRELAAWKSSQHSFEAIAGVRSGAANLGDATGRPERVNGVELEPEVFTMLGVRPLIGRLPDPADARPDAGVALLGEGLWRSRYASDSTILGRTVRIDGRSHRVIGILPAAFRFPLNGQLWVPRRFPMPAADSLQSVLAFGRLRRDVSIEQASAEMRLITARVVRDGRTPERRATTSRVIPFSETEFPPSMKAVLRLMLLASMGVLVIACVNIANLLVARFVARSQDLAVRLALGASRRRIVMLHLAESFVIASAAAVVGVVIADVCVSLFATATASVIEAFWMEFRVDLAALGFTAGLTLLAALAAGLLPALGASRRDPADALRSGSGAGTLRIGRAGRFLVVAEVAFATVFLIVATLLVQSAVALRTRPMPFDAASILTTQLSLTGPAEREREHRILREVLDRVAAMPGVRGASAVTALPGRGSGRNTFSIDGQPSTGATTEFVFVTPGFLQSLGSHLLRGRDFTWTDDARAPRVAWVNVSWAERYLAGRNPLGVRVTVGRGEPFTIVGVVPDLMANDIVTEEAPAMYAPMLQSRGGLARLLVRTEGDPLSYAAALRRVVEAVEADLPLFETASLRDAIFADKKVLEALGALFFAFGVAALLFTATGLYAILAFGVSRRTAEFGVRLAVGAQPADMLRLVLVEGGRRVVAGLAAGLVVATAVAVALASGVEGLDAGNPVAYAVPLALLAVTAFGALLVPARRAARTQPLTALRG